MLAPWSIAMLIHSLTSKCFFVRIQDFTIISIILEQNLYKIKSIIIVKIWKTSILI